MSWEAFNLAAPEFATESEPPTFCALVYKGRRHLVSGPPEAMKTMFALIVGLELIRSSDDTTFALIDFESGPYAIRRMLTDMGAALDEIRRVYYVEPDTAPTQENIDAILDAQVSLAIVDAVAGAFGVSGLDDNKRADAETFGYAWVDPLWRAGVATLLIDHVTKNSDNRGRFAIGSERKAGRTDVHIGLEAVTQLSRGKAGIVRIATHKDRPGWLPRPRAAELHLHSDPDTHALTWEFLPATIEPDAGDPWRPTALMERVSEYLAAQSEPVARSTIEQQVRGKASYLREAIDALTHDGLVLEQVGPGSSRRYSLIKPFQTVVPESSPLVPDPGRPVRPTRPPSYRGDDGTSHDEDERRHLFDDTQPDLDDELERLAMIGDELGLT